MAAADLSRQFIQNMIAGADVGGPHAFDRAIGRQQRGVNKTTKVHHDPVFCLIAKPTPIGEWREGALDRQAAQSALRRLLNTAQFNC